jgi:molybdate transport system permease protein
MKNRIFTLAFAAVLALLILFFFIIIYSLITELRGPGGAGGISRAEVFFAVKLTLVTATASSLLALLISIPVAYILARYRFPFHDAVDILLYLPVVLSPIALGALLLIFFITLPGRLVERIAGGVVFEVPGIIAAQFIVIIGLAISLVKSTFEGIDPAYENIARTLGASRFQTFTRVLLPLSKNGITAALLLTWARAVGEFGATVTLAGATPMKTETLPVAIFLSFASADIRRACVFILIALGMSLAVLFILRKLHARTSQPLL